MFMLISLLLFLLLPQGGLLQHHQHYQHDHNIYQGDDNTLTLDDQHHMNHHHQYETTADENLQHVLLAQAKQQYHVAHTQIEWKYESNHNGELSEFYMHNYESSYPVIAEDQHQQLQTQNQQQQHQQVYEYHQVQHYQQRSLYSRPSDDDHEYHGYQHQQPSQSCNSNENPSSLMYTDHYGLHQYQQHQFHHHHQQNQQQQQQQHHYSADSTCRANSHPSSLLKPSQTSQSQHSHATPHGTSDVQVPVFPRLSDKASSHNSNIESFPLAPHPYHYESSLIAAIRHYWKEVLTLCVGSSIFLNWLIAVIKRRFISSNRNTNRMELAIESAQRQTTRSASKDTNNSSAHDSAFEEAAIPLSLEDVENSKSSSSHRDKSTQSLKTLTTTNTIRQRSSTLKAESMPIPIPVSPNPGHNSQSTSLSNSLNTSEYISRYSSDFDSIQRLGRGGFGVVFEAKNKIDDCHYAVKRICLPLEKEARERVMREVRALAKLDHAGIVRYYNAWLETPPEDWLKQHDAQLGIIHSKDGFNFPSTDGLYERNESELTRGGSKLGEIGDGNSSSLFGSSPFRRKNGLHRYLKENSSSPSLDIVFEGSGSIRLEAEKTIEKTKPNKRKKHNKNGHQDSKLHESGDNNNSDSEDSDFIQFGSKENDNSSKKKNNKPNGNEFSAISQLMDPFSSTSGSDSNRSDSSNEDDESKDDVTNFTGQGGNGLSFTDDKFTSVEKRIDKRNALKYQNQLRRFNNAALAESLHVEKVYLYIQMQLCRKDTLKDWLKTNCENRDKTTLFDLFYQIVDAVEYVHSQDLIHRDLKPSNIFFSLDGTLKIGDFGLCRAKTSVGIGSSLDLQEYVGESEVERGFEAVHTEQVGTQLYMSPEQLNGLSYNQKVDIFAMGLILLELLIPFKTQMQRVNVLFKARNNLYSEEFINEHPQEYELVKSLLSRSPLKRPTAGEIKQHELLASAQLSQPVIDRIYHRRRTISSNSSNE